MLYYFDNLHDATFIKFSLFIYKQKDWIYKWHKDKESIPDLQSAFLYLQHPDQVGRCILKDAEIEQNGMLELRLKRQGRNLNSDYNLT